MEWAGLFGAAAVLAAAVIFLVMWLGAWQAQRHERIRQECLPAYRQAMAAGLWSTPMQAPREPVRLRVWAQVWLQALETVEGSARDRYVELAQQWNLGERLAHWRAQKQPDRRYLAWAAAAACDAPDRLAQVLPELRWPEGRWVALRLARHPSEEWQRQALQWAVAQEIPWVDLAELARIARENHQDWFARHFERMNPKTAARVLEAWASTRPEHAREVAQSMLENPATEGWLVCAALRALQGYHNTPWALDKLKDSRWSVRLAAVRATAKWGARSDVLSLRSLTHDKRFWVRKRAQQALGRVRAC